MRCHAHFTALARTLRLATIKHLLHLLHWVLAAAPVVGLAQPPNGAVAGVPAVTKTVEFRSHGATLSGTLVVPQRVVAALVIVHGSGQELRNVPLAHAWASFGVATLTYDKRGVGKSSGVYAGPEVGTNNVSPENLDLLADDASAAVKALKRRLSSPRTPLGLFGASQAGWIIPLAAVRTPDVKFMILWSGPLVNTLEQLRFQFFTAGKADFWDHHSETEAREHVRSDPNRYQFIATDPVDSLKKLSIPGIWLFGGHDVNVPVGLSIERLSALTASGKHFKYRLLPNSGHNLSADEDPLAKSVDWLTTTVVPALGGR